MANTWQQLALLFAGALASVMGGVLIRPPFPEKYLYILSTTVVILTLYGSGAISKLWHSYNLWKRRGNKLVAPKVGILSDMGWEPENAEIRTWTDISPEKWKKEIEKLAMESKVKIKVELIDAGKNFDPYIVILNPYGGVYPERDVKNFDTLNKIFNYVNEGGQFVNVADVPGYWAYNPLLKRRLDATPPIYNIIYNTSNGKTLIGLVRPFELTPFMEKLGLRVLNIEKTEHCKWDVEFEDKFNRTIEDINEVEVHRVVILERNVEAIIKPKPEQRGGITPLFFVKYGDGKFLISLVFFDRKYPQNDKMKVILAKIIIELVREESKRNK